MHVQDAESMGGKPAPNGCRSGLTSLMLTSNSTPVYVTPTIIPHVPSEPGGAASLAALNDHHASSNAAAWAFKLERSSRAQMLAERRLCLDISATGTIVWACSGTPGSLFGASPAALCGQSISSFVDVFADFTSGESERQP
jgi:hypothetical protein